MKTNLIACASAFALLLGFSSVALADSKQPDDAIKQNLDQNQAFSNCNSSAITNGHVVFGGSSAINPLAGAASNNANTNASAIDDPQTADVCDLSDSQRVEPRSWWYSLAHIIDRATAISKKPAE